MDFLTTSQAAKDINMSQGRIAALIKAGKIPAKQAGRTWIINREDWEAFKLKERRPGRPSGNKSN